MHKNEKITAIEWAEIGAALSACIAAMDADSFKTPVELLSDKLVIREVTTEELSIVLEITDRRISQLWKVGHIPEPRKEGKRHYFPLLLTVQAYIQFLRHR